MVAEVEGGDNLFLREHVWTFELGSSMSLSQDNKDHVLKYAFRAHLISDIESISATNFRLNKIAKKAVFSPLS